MRAAARPGRVRNGAASLALCVVFWRFYAIGKRTIIPPEGFWRFSVRFRQRHAAAMSLAVQAYGVTVAQDESGSNDLIDAATAADFGPRFFS